MGLGSILGSFHTKRREFCYVCGEVPKAEGSYARVNPYVLTIEPSHTLLLIDRNANYGITTLWYHSWHFCLSTSSMLLGLGMKPSDRPTKLRRRWEDGQLITPPPRLNGIRIKMQSFWKLADKWLKWQWLSWRISCTWARRWVQPIGF